MATSSRDSSQRWFSVGRSLEQDAATARRAAAHEALTGDDARAVTIDAPVAGSPTYGEIARLHGPDGYHDQTLAVLAVG